VVGLLRRFGLLFGIRRRTLSSAWSLIVAGDLRGVLRRSVRRISHLRPVALIGHAEWRRRYVDLTDTDRARILAHPSAMTFTVTVGLGDGAGATLASLDGQLHENWSTSPVAIRMTGRWIIELDAGVVLHEAALWALAASIDADPDLRLVYADHDHLDVDGRHGDPSFLPDWNPELFAGLGRISSLTARHPDVDPNMITALDAETVAHLPLLLASSPTPSPGFASPTPTPTPTKPLPRVSILIPTRDQGPLLETCLRSIRGLSTHPDVELVLVDHETTEIQARRVIDGLVDDPDAVVIEHRGPFNFAAMMNRAADAATGDVLVLLNNDTEVVSAGWLESMVAHLERPGVGVVGALLLFTDGTIQHAGVHPGLGGLMGHGHKHRPGDDPGHLGRLRVAHRVAAVTGACLAIRTDLWHELGGLDEDLAVAYNDIDLCLRARGTGRAVILEPRAILHHHESVSRGYDDDPVRRARLQSEVDRMRERWGAQLDVDPAYSPNLTLTEPGFAPADPPRVIPPWRT
jgi:GT2 family glycosyltransferase